MRTIVRYVDGRAVWSENTPASPVMHASRGGTLVVGTPAVSKRDAYRAFVRAEQAKLDAALRALR